MGSEGLGGSWSRYRDFGDRGLAGDSCRDRLFAFALLNPELEPDSASLSASSMLAGVGIAAECLSAWFSAWLGGVLGPSEFS